MSGTLYVVAGPIGNLEDITLRALRVLQEVDLIACEDTRKSSRLLGRHNIKKPLTCYNAHTSMKKTAHLVERLSSGDDIALLTDGGTPGISDPGQVLVAQARERGLAVVPLPGPSALTTALSVSGFSSVGCCFLGFLSPRGGRRRRELRDAAHGAQTLVCYESPHRIRKLLGDIEKSLGNVDILVAREMSKLHEQFLRGRVGQLKDANFPEKGEFTVVIWLKNVNKRQKNADNRDERSSS